MSSLDPTTLTPDQLTAMLRAWASGLYSDEAATDLLIAHRVWLTRLDFLTTCVDAIDDGWTRDGTTPMASIDWDRAAHVADQASCSTSEAAVLRLAASLAGTGTGSLADLARGLDATNTARLLDAIAHSAGWHQHGITHTVTGHITDQSAGHRAGRATGRLLPAPNTSPTVPGHA